MKVLLATRNDAKLAELRRIVGLLLEETRERLRARGVELVVDDAADTQLVYDGNGGPVTLVSPTTVRLLLSFTGGSSGPASC